MKSTAKILLVSSLMLALQACKTTGGSEEVIKDVVRPVASNIPMPTAVVSQVSYINTSIIPTTTTGGRLDVSLIDDFMADVTPNVRHYPPNFPSNTQRYNTRKNIKVFESFLLPYAKASDASYEVIIRAAQLSGMARNLDMGSEYTVNGSNYVARALKLKPNDIEANLLYGIMLSEGGAFKTGRKYLDKAASLGSVEAEQSIAQADLLSDERPLALSRLQKLQQSNPSNLVLQAQISIVENGKYYIWDIPAPNVKVKPIG